MNLFSMPSAVIGLMGRRPQQQNPLLGLVQPQMADEFDEKNFSAAPNGYVESPQGMYFPADANAQTAARQQMQASATGPQAGNPRERVSGWRVLDRVLGGQTVSEGLDAERARLQAEADRPNQLAIAQENERIARALGPQALLAFRTNGAELGKSLGQQYAPQVVAEGSALAIPGQGAFNINERKAVVGDRVVGLGGNGQAPRELLTVEPSYDDRTKRINATNPVALAQDATLVNPYTGATIAQGLSRPDVQNIAPGGEALAFDAAGNVINRVGSTQQKPPSAAQLKRADDLELALTADENSIARVESALASIIDPDGAGPGRPAIRVGPGANLSAGVRNALGISDANSLGIAQIKTTVESLRQGILNDATGPQTEGDALRALNGILAGINDPAVIAQGFNDYLTAKRRTAQVRREQLARVRGENAGGGGGPTGNQTPPLPPGFVLD